MSDGGAAFDGNAWEVARGLQERGASPADIAAELARRGLDPESVRVVLGALPGAPVPPALPEARLELSTNALSPRLFAFADLGLEGERRVVALYWGVFGLALAALTTGGLLLDLAGVTTSSSPWGSFAVEALPWVGYPLSVAALARGAWLLFRR